MSAAAEDTISRLNTEVLMRKSRRIRFVVALLVLAGCGSTVAGPATSPGELAGGVNAELGVNGSNATSSMAAGAPGAPGAPGAQSVDSGLASEQPGSQSATSGAPDRTPDSIDSPSPDRPAAVVEARGSTAPIDVGFVVGDDAEAYYAALGFSNVTTGNMRNQVQAIVRYVNDHGGLAGRKIRPVFHNGDASKSLAQNEAEACATFTQDHRVFAVVAGGGSSVFVECLAKAGVVLIASNVSQREALVQKVNGLYWAPPQLTSDRFALTYLDQLYALGFFKGAKLGLLHHDTPDDKDLAARVIKPWLARHNLALTAEAAMDYSNGASQGQGFAFQFNARGVTHVLNFVEGNVVFFMQAAENQQYRPRYALSSRDGPSAWVQRLAPAAQLRGSLGIGWWPLGDVDPQHNPGDVSSNQTVCRKVMSDAGEDMSNVLVVAISHRTCEGVFFLHATASRITTTVKTDTFIAAARQLGSNFRSVLTFRTFFGPRRYDGVAAIRRFTFDQGCGCFFYDGPLRSLSRG